MKDFLIGAFIILLLCSPVILLIVLIFMIRKRKKREALGIHAKLFNARFSVDPLTLQDNWLTCTILFILSALYFCEVIFALNTTGKAHTPSVLTLLAFGGVSHSLVTEHHEWYRIFTAPFLHANITHLLFNGIALLYAGRVLEKQLGRVGFLAIYLMGGIGGSLLSITMNPPNVISVGASGAIMGLFAAVMAVSFHAVNEERKNGLRFFSLRVLIPSLLPQASPNGLHIDYGAHFGGVIGGILGAIIMLISWPADSLLPRFRSFAYIISILGILATLGSFGLVAVHYPAFVRVGKSKAVCEKIMTEYAQKNGVDPAKYMKENLAWLNSCVKSQLKIPAN